MSSSDHPDHDIIDPLTDDPLAFLYEAGDEDENEDSTADHPGYGSLMGVGVRKAAPTGKPAKAMAIMLDELEAQRAAEVMEINAGQLMTNPDRSSRQVGFLGLDPVDAMKVEEEEDDLAETLSWEAEAEADDNADWQPENPLAGTGIGAEKDDAGWQPENPLAGTEFEHAAADDDDWAEPLAPAEEPALEEQAWSANAPAEEPQFEEVEWEAPLAAAEAGEEPVATEAAIETPDEAIEPVSLEEPVAETEELASGHPSPIDWRPMSESAVPPRPIQTAPIAWQSLLSKRPPKKQVDLTPIDWQEIPEEAAPVAEALPEPAPPVDDGWPDSGEEPFELPAEPAAPEWQAFDAEESVEEKAVEEVEEAEEAEEPEEPEEVEELAALAEDEWESFAAEEQAGPSETEWSAFFTPESQESGLLPEPEEIEIVRFPAPPVVAPEPVSHHPLRAIMMQSHQRTPPPSRLKPVLKWLRARFNTVVLPLLKQLWAWVRVKWAEIAARARRD